MPAAIPSKRDLLALIKAIHSELVTALSEGEIGLVLAVCKEFLKTIKLMLSKIEGMVINNSETRKITSQNNFARTHQQEHNGQLVVLLLQLQESLEKIPQNVVNKSIELSSNTASSSSSNNALTDSATKTPAKFNPNASAVAASPSGSTGMNLVLNKQHERALAQMQRAVAVAVSHVRDLAQRQILDSVVALLSGYIKSVLLTVHKEGLISSTSGNTEHKTTDDGHPDLNCSQAVNTLLRQMPAMMRAHLLCLPQYFKPVALAIEEVCLRTMNAYISVVALQRPVNEQTRLRVTKEISAIEVMISSGIGCQISHKQDCPVLQEFK